MTRLQFSAAAAVVVSALLLSSARTGAQASVDWASASALGDVFQASGSQITIFGHGGGASKGQIALPAGAGSITALALDASLDLFAATDLGRLFRVSHGPGHAIDEPVTGGIGSNARSLAFDEQDRLYIGYGGTQGTIARYDPNVNVPSRPYTLAASRTVTCDVSPAPGIWLDVTPRTLGTPAAQFGVYTCGGRDVRFVDLLSGAAPAVLETLPNFPGGNDESARDIRLLAPVASAPLGNDALLDEVKGVQGGMVVAYGTNVVLLDRSGALISSYDVGSGASGLDHWCCLAVSPTGGAVWAADATSSSARRLSLNALPLAANATTSGTAPVSALAVNGDPRLAQAMRLLSVTPDAESSSWFFDGTPSAQRFVGQADPDPAGPPVVFPLRVAVVLFESRSGGPFPDLNVNSRFATLAPLPDPPITAISASRGRASFFRLTRLSQQAYAAPHRTTVGIEYNLPTNPTGFLTGLYSDTNHGDRGFVRGNGDVDQFDSLIRTEWFQTNEFMRGSTFGSNDFIVAKQDAAVATLGSYRTDVQLGASLPVRVSYPFQVTADLCASLVLTVARPAPANVIVGSSLTTLNHLGEGIPYFSPTGGTTCGANLNVLPFTAEVQQQNDFAAGKTYNFCVVQLPAVSSSRVADVCGQFSVK